MKGRTSGGFESLKNSREIQRSQTTSEEGCLCENRMESENNKGACSIPTALESGRNGRGAKVSKLMEAILERDNMNKAYKSVKRNKGSHGIDGMTVDELLPHLKENGGKLTKEILTGEYKPQAVLRVEIPKPDGGKRRLGIPNVIDRMVQQAIAQKVSPIFEQVFSESSYGFRPGKSCHLAIKQAQKYMNAGNTWVVDIDLEKYFDTVNHDKLMELIAREVKDKRVLRLIRAYLKSGVMVNGITAVTEKGCPQGGPLSPLLSNIMLNELDKELETRGHKFCRYADDNQIYVQSKKSSKTSNGKCHKVLGRRVEIESEQAEKCNRQTMGAEILRIQLLPNKGRSENKDTSEIANQNQRKDKVHYIKKQWMEHGISIPKTKAGNTRMGQLF